MSDYPYAKEIETNYENFIAICPICGFRNIFNRATDLESFSPISYRVVTCQSEQCGEKFAIGGDTVAPAYKLLIGDAYAFKREKRYISSILTINQAYEVFMGHYFKVEMIYKPYAKEARRDNKRVEELFGLLYDTIDDYSFEILRNIFLNWILLNKKAKNLDDSENNIQLLVESKELKKKPKIAKVRSFENKKVADVLVKLYCTKINKLRNNIVHKYAYRPNLCEAEAALEEGKSIILALANLLDTSESDINWYINRKNVMKNIDRYNKQKNA